MAIEPVRPISRDDIEQARTRIAGTVLRTPLVKLDLGGGAPDIRLKLENLQPTNAYKIRGAANAVACLSDAERARGVWTISAGNAGQGVAYAARQFLDEMGGLAAAFLAYADKWSASAIESDWDGYCAESQGIIEALTQRIIRENRDLYTLAEREKKAA